ncbi:MAG: TerB family tellurite resistance protein [Albidovulum sp.]|nr:TerB family tellurite resistance protein [Albidovulum sp.]MDE0533878.1 TerB family tellurite resistance protein [Albidovulum sp.]
MSVWGKLIGGALGFAIGGPLGALVGVGAGHLTDRHRKAARKAERLQSASSPGIGESQENRQASFILSFVALAAKLSKVDGHITRDELETLMRVFPVPRHASFLVSEIFRQAEKDPTGFEVYASQIADLFRDNRAALEDLLGALVLIARADGVLHSAERDYITRVAEIFGLGSADVGRILGSFARSAEPGENDPYDVLGIGRGASDKEIKSAHRKILRENHPDVAMGRGLPEEFIEVSNRKMAEANAAYDRIKQERGIA